MSITSPANKPFHDRMRLSAGVNYVLRLMRTYTDLVGGDPTTALVFIAAAQACTQHVKVRPEALQEETFIRDEMRRPVSLSALARSLGLPVETTRRQVRRLIVLNDAGRLAGILSLGDVAADYGAKQVGRTLEEISEDANEA